MWLLNFVFVINMQPPKPSDRAQVQSKEVRLPDSGPITLDDQDVQIVSFPFFLLFLLYILFKGLFLFLLSINLYFPSCWRPNLVSTMKRTKDHWIFFSFLWTTSCFIKFSLNRLIFIDVLSSSTFWTPLCWYMAELVPFLMIKWYWNLDKIKEVSRLELKSIALCSLLLYVWILSWTASFEGVLFQICCSFIYLQNCECKL